MAKFDVKNKDKGVRQPPSTVGGTVVDNSGTSDTLSGVGIGGTVAGGGEVSQDVRRIAGFLVSFSKEPTGQYFPLYEGRNTIGADYMKMNIVLNEKSVSDEHAVITIRILDGTTMVRIRDESSFGTYVDGTDIDQLPDIDRRLQNGSMLQIGGYKLLVMIIDFQKMNTTPEPEFKEKY